MLSLSRYFSITLFLLFSFKLYSAEIRLVENTEQLMQALETPVKDLMIQLTPGIYQGNFFIRHPVELQGQEGVIIDANSQGDALRVQSANVSIGDLHIRNWGDDLTAMNAGIFVEDHANDVLIQDNVLVGDTTGIWLARTSGARILRNKVKGNPDMRSTDRGNGIHLSNVTYAEVIGNEVWHSRDGLYIISSQNNLLKDNYLHDVRYGIHYMYSHSNEVIGNRTERTRAGYALMQSRNLTVRDNTTINSEDYGILLNFITASTLENNYIEGVHQSEARDAQGAFGKGFFVYNSTQNKIRGNTIKQAEIGIHLTAGSEDNKVAGNHFIHNQTQVKYVATREQEWSENGSGNYWSNYLGWDMNHDQIGDTVFEPNDNIDRLLWLYPQARLLMDSPAILLLRWVQRLFPVLKSPGVRDSFPLMRVNEPTALSGTSLSLTNLRASL